MTTIINADTSGGLKLTSDTSGALDIQSAGSTKLSIDSSGNVGIGATSPSKPLQVKQTAAGSGLSQTDIRATRDEYGADFSGYIDQGVGHGAIISSVDNGTATERVRITNAGKVGIGTTSPDGRLHVHTSSAGTVTAATDANQLVLESTANVGMSFLTGNASVARIKFGDPDSNSSGAIVYAHSGDSMRFNTAGSERMRIDSSGKVGIGTTSPSTTLHVAKTTTTLPTIAGDCVGILASNGTSALSLISGTGTSVLRFGDSSDENAGQIAYAHSVDAMRFNTNGAEHMRIRSDGQVLINSTSIIASDTAPLQVTGGSVTAVALRGGTNNYFMAFYKQSNNTLIGSITGSSGTSTSFNTSSDYRLKENVNYTWDATTRLKQLKPARFNFIADSDNTVDGFLAHEVSSIVPEAITGTKDEVNSDGNPIYQGIDQSKLVPLLVKTIQEQQTVIQALETRITALEAG